MADIDQKNTAENFDKEFSLNKKKKEARSGHIPSWIMILVGVAVIVAVVIARQPAIRSGVNGTRASVNVPSGQSGYGNTVSLTGDEKADVKELEARFVSQKGTAASFYVTGDDRLYSMQMDALPTDDQGRVISDENEAPNSAVYWVDEKPFAVSLEPAEAEETVKAEPGDVSVYEVDGKAYNVELEAVSSDELAKLSDAELTGVIQVGDVYYRLRMTPAETVNAAAGPDETAAAGAEQQKAEAVDPIDGQPSADTDPFGTDKSADADTGKKEVAWFNGKPYEVSVEPFSGAETHSSTGLENNGKSVIPVTVIDPKDKKAAVFDTDTGRYEIQAVEIDPENADPDRTTQPVVWVDETPLRVSLQSDNAGSFDILMNAVSEEELPELYESHFGVAYTSGEKAAEPETESTESAPEANDPEPVPTEESKQEGWFVGMFHSIFGGSPTETPTPQVTVIAVTPTAQPERPTATPIIVRMAPTATVQGPMRLDDADDGTDITSEPKALDPKASDWEDPALWTDDVDDPAAVAAQQMQSVGANGDPDAMIRVFPTSTVRSVVSVDVTVLEETPVSSENREAATAEPTPEELPHTGMAESWNIPSMLAMLVGLLLVIAGVRRLRMNR